VLSQAKFRDAFAADLPAVLAATQRPVAEAAFSQRAGPPMEAPALLGRCRIGRHTGGH
jgi:hypothetical protein